MLAWLHQVHKPCVGQPGKTVERTHTHTHTHVRFGVDRGGRGGSQLMRLCVTPLPDTLAALGEQGAGPMAPVSCIAMVTFVG